MLEGRMRLDATRLSAAVPGWDFKSGCRFSNGCDRWTARCRMTAFGYAREEAWVEDAHLEILGGVAGELENLGGEVLCRNRRDGAGAGG